MVGNASVDANGTVSLSGNMEAIQAGAHAWRGPAPAVRRPRPPVKRLVYAGFPSELSLSADQQQAKCAEKGMTLAVFHSMEDWANMRRAIKGISTITRDSCVRVGLLFTQVRILTLGFCRNVGLLAGPRILKSGFWKSQK